MANEITKTPEIKADIVNNQVDIGKRIDINKPSTEISRDEVDIGKRINTPKDVTPSDTDGVTKKEAEVSDDLSEKIKAYVNDLKEKAKYPDTINEDCIDSDKLEVQSPEKVRELREEFDDKKSDLRNEWEQLNGREWPRYTEQEIQELGITDRKPGDRYDAHHIQPLQLGGKNEASNITPLNVTTHREIHSNSGSCKALVDNLVGGVA